MDSADSLSLLERKIAAHRPRPAPDQSGPEQLLFTAFAREIERKLGLHLRAGAHRSHQRASAEIVEMIPEQALICLLDGPGEAAGVLVMDGGCLSALIEMMTLGEIRPGAPQPRRPTRTDAAMVAGLVDAMLDGFDRLLAADPAISWAGGYRYGSHLADARPLALVLDEPAYRMLTLDLSFDDGDRRGTLGLILPALGRTAIPAPPTSAEEEAVAPDTAFADELARTVDGVQADLHAVLARIAVPLTDFLALETGQSLTLPADALRHVQIEGADGRLLGLASLGQGGGQRVLRLDPPSATDAPPIAPPVAVAVVVAASDQPLHRAPPVSERTAPSQSGLRAMPDAAELLADRVVAAPDSDPTTSQAGTGVPHPGATPARSA